MNYTKEVYNNIYMKEDISIINEYLYYIYIYEKMSNKNIARILKLPIPIISAIKKEFINLGILEQNKGVNLTTKGIAYIEKTMGLKGLNKKLVISIIEKKYDFYNMFKGELEILKHIFEEKPRADLSIDQTECSAETSLKRAVLALENNSILGKNILCLGDDDLISIAIKVLLKKIFDQNINETCKISVVDIDDRILLYIKNFDNNISTIKKDLTEKIDEENLHNYNVVFTDPPYTLEGLSLFLNRTKLNLKRDFGKIFLSFGSKDNFTYLEIQKLFSRLNLVVKNILDDFNSYKGASIIGGRSNMYILESLPLQNIASLNQNYENEIYTGKLNKKNKNYQCTMCKKIFILGPDKKFKFIEDLKKNGCSQCGNHSFKLTALSKINKNL